LACLFFGVPFFWRAFFFGVPFFGDGKLGLSIILMIFAIFRNLSSYKKTVCTTRFSYKWIFWEIWEVEFNFHRWFLEKLLSLEKATSVIFSNFWQLSDNRPLYNEIKKRAYSVSMIYSLVRIHEKRRLKIYTLFYLRNFLLKQHLDFQKS
jgi:hypothetical protein